MQLLLKGLDKVNIRIMTSGKKSIQSDQQGMVAIAVTSVLMVVISLIVMGYSQSIRNEQRQALDNQLSTQAFYAAESGVNLAQSKINSTLGGDVNADIKKSECKGNALGIDPDSDYKIDSSTGSEITCLLVSSESTEQVFQSVGSEAKATRVYANGGGIDNIVFSWESDSSKDLGSCTGGSALDAARTCKQPILRIDIVPLSPSMSQTGLQNSQYTAFLSPRGGGTLTGTAYAPNASQSMSTSPSIVSSSCGLGLGDKLCAVRVTGLADSGTGFAVRMISLYGNSNVSISSQSPTGKRLINGQYTIDSTAKAVDVVRRVQVRLSSLGKDSVTWAIGASGDGSSKSGVCKLYKINSGAVTDDCATPTP